MMTNAEYIPGYRNLDVWKKSDELVLLIYKLTKKYPHDEIFGLISQMRRCAVSVPANTVEGYGRRTLKDKLQFLYIARGSLNELEYYLDVSLRLKYISQADYDEVWKLRGEVGRLLNGFIKSLEK